MTLIQPNMPAPNTLSSDKEYWPGWVERDWQILQDDLKQRGSNVLTPPYNAVGNGTFDDTTAIQSAVDAVSANGGGVLLLPGNKTYTVQTIMPKPNVIIDLQGSTLKIRNNANLPLFYDYLKPTITSNFGVVNGTLDCNMQNNSDAINQSAGTFWLTNWDNLYFRNLTVKNAFRNIFNFFGVRNVVAENIKVIDNGKSNANNFYSYGFSAEASPQRRNENISLKNFICQNMYGFGVHIRQTDNFELSNLEFIDLSRTNDSIAITVTDSNQGHIENVWIKKSAKTYSVDSHAIEINNSNRLTIRNVTVDSVRTSAILFGDNGTGVVGKQIHLTNVVTTNTPSFSLSVNYVDGLVVSNSEFDKGFTTTYALPSKNVMFERCKFLVNCNALMMYDRFGYRNTTFANAVVFMKQGSFVSMSYALSIDIGATGTVSLSLAQGENHMVGYVDVVSKYKDNFSQGTWERYGVWVSGSSVQTATQLHKLIGSVERSPAITISGTNVTIVNGTGVILAVTVLYSNINSYSVSLT